MWKFQTFGCMKGHQGDAIPVKAHMVNPPLKGEGIVTMRVTPGDAVRVQASVYDIAGEKVKDLPEAVSAGRITWDGKTDDGDIVADGVYFCRIVGINVQFARTYTIVLKK